MSTLESCGSYTCCHLDRGSWALVAPPVVSAMPEGSTSVCGVVYVWTSSSDSSPQMSTLTILFRGRWRSAQFAIFLGRVIGQQWCRQVLEEQVWRERQSGHHTWLGSVSGHSLQQSFAPYGFVVMKAGCWLLYICRQHEQRHRHRCHKRRDQGYYTPNSLSRGSMTSRKKTGDRTDPLRTPRSRVNSADNWLPTLILVLEWSYQSLISLQVFPLMPASYKHLRRTGYCTQSKAFWRW